MVRQASVSQDRKLTRLSQVLKLLRETDEIEALFEATVPFLCQELGYSLVWFGTYQPQEDCLMGYDAVSPGEKRWLHREHLLLESGSLLEQVFVQRRPLQVPDLGQERKAGRWRTIAQTLDIQGSLLFPIHYQTVCYGVALFGIPEWGMAPQADDIAALSILCGQLAVALHQIATVHQEKQQKRPEEPLLRLLDQLREQPTLQEQLQCIVAETHQFIGTSRTLLYWFDPDRRVFWPRLLKQVQGSGTGFSPPGVLAIADCQDLYQTLKRDRVLSISDTSSALQSSISSYLHGQIQVRSLLVAPIGSGTQLLGFIVTGGIAAHLWSEGEKRYLQGVAQLATLVAPQDQIDQAIGTGKADQAVIAALGLAVRDRQDWHEALRQTADYLFERLQVERLLLIHYQDARQSFPILFQHQAGRRKLLNGPLAKLDELDRLLLDEHPEGLMVEDWQSDLRLMRWRSQLFSRAGVRSLLVCPTAPSNFGEGALLLTREQPRTWSAADLALFRDLSRQMTTVLHQRRLSDQMQQLQTWHQALQWGLTSLHQETEPKRLDRVGLQAIAQLLQVPWVALLDWSPREGQMRWVDAVHLDSQWSQLSTPVLDGLRDPLLQQALQATDWLIQPVDHLSPMTRQWLAFPQLAQLLVLPLRDSSSDVPQGLILMGESQAHPWMERPLSLCRILIQQLAWSRRSLRQRQHLQLRQAELEQLHGYKQFCGERFQRTLADQLQRLQELTPEGERILQEGLERMNQAIAGLKEVFEAEGQTLQIRTQTFPVIRLLKQAKHRIDSLISQRQLWSQFHWSEVQQHQLCGDSLKLENAIHSVLVAACDRCLIGGRIDVWCNAQPEGLLELSVTDNGIIDPQLLAALQPTADQSDPLVRSLLEEEPGLRLHLAQTLMEKLGGSLELLPLEDGRTVSRLLIPGLFLD